MQKIYSIKEKTLVMLIDDIRALYMAFLDSLRSILKDSLKNTSIFILVKLCKTVHNTVKNNCGGYFRL